MTTEKPEMIFWLNDARGIYLPRDFATSFVDRAKHVSGVSDEDWAILEAGPDHEHYWDTWDDVLTDAVVVDTDGVRHRLYQNSDLYLVPEGMEWSDDADTFVWPDQQQEDAD